MLSLVENKSTFGLKFKHFIISSKYFWFIIHFVLVSCFLESISASSSNIPGMGVSVSPSYYVAKYNSILDVPLDPCLLTLCYPFYLLLLLLLLLPMCYQFGLKSEYYVNCYNAKDF